MYYGVYIKRKQHKFTQKDIANKLYMSIPSYQNRENGKLEFSIREGKRLAKLYGCTLDDLFQLEESK